MMVRIRYTGCGNNFLNDSGCRPVDRKGRMPMKRMVTSAVIASALLGFGWGIAGAEGTENSAVQWDVGTDNRIHNVELADGNVSANGVRAKNVSASTVSGGYVYSHGGVIGDVKFGTDGTLTGIPDVRDLSKADPSSAVNVKTLLDTIAHLEARIAALEKKAGSHGMIGGADGPTAIHLMEKKENPESKTNS